MHKAAGFTPAQLLFHVRPDPLKLIAQGPSKKRSRYLLKILANGSADKKNIFKNHLCRNIIKTKQKNSN